MKGYFYLFLFFLQLTFISNIAVAQNQDSLLLDASLENCVNYALKRQPAIQQSLIDQQIADREIKASLADWLPQLNLTANYQNNFQIPSTKFGNQVVNIGAYNSSTVGFGLTQTIFDRDVLLAASSAKDVRTEFKQLAISTRIDVVANVSKAFYDVLLSQKQIELLDEDIVLLERTQRDSYNQYKSGIVDKTDYQRATISLNNSKAARKTAEEQLKSKYATLKQMMGYPIMSPLRLVRDSAVMANEALSIDTAEEVNFENRIEYQLLNTEKKLLEANLRYYKWGFLPSVSAFGQYNLNYYNSQFNQLFEENFPNSYVGLSLSIPIFQGTKRLQQIKSAQLQLNRMEYDFKAVRDSIYVQYTQSLSTYKSNLANFYIQKDNLALASDVYNVIQLQYRAGVKTYLDVVVANDNLFTAQINYVNSLYTVLMTRVDVQRALGTLQY